MASSRPSRRAPAGARGGMQRGADGALASSRRTTEREDSRAPRHARAADVTFGAVRRLDSGRNPDRHPAVRWPDDRRPHARRVDNASTAVAGDLRRRLHAPDPVLASDDAQPVGGGDGVQPMLVAERKAPKRDRVEANARLTGSTAAVLLVLLAIEGFTLLAIHPLLNVHVFVGMLLIPPVLLKVGSTTWKFAKYYLGDPEFRRKGPPVALLRLLGPIVVVLTLVVLVSGVALLVASPAWRNGLLFLHKASFILWFGVMTVHVLGHVLDTAKLAPRDWYRRTRRQIAGASARQWLVAGAIVVGLIAGAITLPHVGSWVTGGHPLSGVARR